MAVFKELASSDIKSAKSYLSALVEILQQDLSGTSSRRKFQHFISSSGVAPGVTSSIFQSVYDSDFTTVGANAELDVTFGLYQSGSIATAASTGTDAAGKMLFASSSIQCREKIDIYKSFAQALLGDSTLQFTAPVDSSTAADGIDAAIFLSFKRLFSRDKIKRETFAAKIYKYANEVTHAGNQTSGSNHPGNINTVISGSELTSSLVYTDVGSATNRTVLVGGEVGSVVESTNTSNTVGLLFYDRGIAVLDANKVFSGSQVVSGAVSSVNGGTAFGLAAGQSVVGGKSGFTAGTQYAPTFSPNFYVSGSIDNIVDHICGIRFHTGSSTAITFQNVTNINSTLVSCQLGPDEFNYSSNPTARDSENRLVVIESGQEDISQTFVFVTGIGLYDSNDNLLAIAKLSRPIEKNPEKSLSCRIRLDY